MSSQRQIQVEMRSRQTTWISKPQTLAALSRMFVFMLQVTATLMFAAVCQLLKVVLPRTMQERLVEKSGGAEKRRQTGLSPMDMLQAVGGYQFLKATISAYALEAGVQTVSQGGRPLPVEVVTLAGETRHLTDFVNQSRPLVVVFGSCTCPPFMVNLQELQTLQGDLGHAVDFLMVYTREAHPMDGWALRRNIFYVDQHEDIKDRIRAAKALQNYCNLTIPLVLDTMSDNAVITYAAYPERYCVMTRDKLLYFSSRGPDYNLIDNLKQWLYKEIGQI